MIVLDYQEKLLILISCLIFVVLSAIIMACKLAPFCWLYKYCPLRARYDDDDETIKMEKRKKQMVYYGGAPPPIPGIKTSYLDDHCSSPSEGPNGNLGYFKARNSVPFSVDGKLLMQQKSRSSVSTSGSFEENRVDTASFQSKKKSSVSEKSLVSSNESEHVAAPHLSCSVMYDDGDEKLSIFIKNVTNLEPNLLGTANDAFVRILVVRDTKRRWRQKGDVSLDQLVNAEKNGYEFCEFRTQLIRRNLNPVFNEYFTTELKDKEKNSTIIKFAVYNVDKFSQQNIVGECFINIGKTLTNQLKDYSVPLKEFKPDLGDIYVALTYLPTSQRLNVTVIKATNLKPANKLLTINPFVKLLMVHRGKTVEKYRTPVQFSTPNPVYNERLTFDLPSTEVDKVTLLLLVYHQDVKESSAETGDESAFSSPSSSGASSSSKTGLPPKKSSAGSLSRKRRSLSVESGSKSDFAGSLYKSKSSSKLNARYICLGRVALGANCKSAERNHWFEVMCNPRKQIARVHKLQP